MLPALFSQVKREKAHHAVLVHLYTRKISAIIDNFLLISFHPKVKTKSTAESVAYNSYPTSLYNLVSNLGERTTSSSKVAIRFQ